MVPLLTTTRKYNTERRKSGRREEGHELCVVHHGRILHISFRAFGTRLYSARLLVRSQHIWYIPSIREENYSRKHRKVVCVLQSSAQSGLLWVFFYH